MKKMLFITLMVLVASCSSTKDRKVASSEETQETVQFASNRDITGTYLAVSQYGEDRDGPNKAATRVYFQEIEGEKGKYHAVLLEYVDLVKMGPSFIASDKLPGLAKKTGFLKNITHSISAYKVEPTAKTGVFEMYPLVVVGDKIEAKKSVKPRILTLSSDEGSDPLQGASISQAKSDEPTEIFFPNSDDERKTGAQYKIAKFIYKKAKLESTWRKSFLPGPYLSQYANVDDVVLELSGAGDATAARFVINEKMAAKVSKEKRAQIFTNPKSAFLKGDFTVTEPLDGMFIFTAVASDKDSSSIVEGKIGLFIDIFDASKSMNKDVVELALIDSENPTDFLMYYEHPANGEGK